MREEDLDVGRVRGEFVASQLADLRWLGLDWEEGPDVGGAHAPYLQSQRQVLYEAAIETLKAQGRVYECFCSRREIAEAASAPNGPQDEGPVYPGTCRSASEEWKAERRRNRSPALRFLVPDSHVTFVDLLQGEQSVRPAQDLGDFVVRRGDGIAAYQLAVVVDDIAMGITDVVRGADLLPSTARQLLIYQALGAAPPRWLHVPLLLGPDGARLAKRHGAVSVGTLRDQGYLAEEVVGWLASTCGLAAVGERISAPELVPRFDLDAVPRLATKIARFLPQRLQR